MFFFKLLLLLFSIKVPAHRIAKQNKKPKLNLNKTKQQQRRHRQRQQKQNLGNYQTSSDLAG